MSPFVFLLIDIISFFFKYQQLSYFFFQRKIKNKPAKLCQRLKIADGNEANFPKWIKVKAIPNPEFCIPTSIEIVFFTSFGNLKYWEMQ